MGGSWGQLSAAFSGFTSLSTIVRGRNDKWDQVLGACGAVSASRGGGHRCMGSLGISICTLTTMCALGRGHHEPKTNIRTTRGGRDSDGACR
eukprot:g14870.t2